MYTWGAPMNVEASKGIIAVEMDFYPTFQAHAPSSEISIVLYTRKKPRAFVHVHIHVRTCVM